MIKKPKFLEWILGLLAAYYGLSIFVKTIESGVAKDIIVVLFFAYIIYKQIYG